MEQASGDHAEYWVGRQRGAERPLGPAGSRGRRSPLDPGDYRTTARQLSTLLNRTLLEGVAIPPLEVEIGA
jgi:hypothetical protein